MIKSDCEFLFPPRHVYIYIYFFFQGMYIFVIYTHTPFFSQERRTPQQKSTIDRDVSLQKKRGQDWRLLAFPTLQRQKTAGCVRAHQAHTGIHLVGFFGTRN